MAPPGRTRTTAEATAEGLRLFLAGVPWHVGEDTLRRDFEECGVIEDLFLLRDSNGDSKGKAFLTFRDKSSAEKALEFDNTEYAGRTLFVKVAESKDKSTKPAQSSKSEPKGSKGVDTEWGLKDPGQKPDGCRSICVKNLGPTSEEDLRSLLRPCILQSVRMVIDRYTGESRGIAFVDFRDSDEVDKAMAKNGANMDGWKVEMYYEAPRERPRPEGCLAVAIKKLHPQTTEVDVVGLFKGLKSLTDVRVIRKSGEKDCIGLAFAEFSDPADVEEAVRRDGGNVRGRVVFICYETKVKAGEKGTGSVKKQGIFQWAVKKFNEEAAKDEGSTPVEGAKKKRDKKAAKAEPKVQAGAELAAPAAEGGKKTKRKKPTETEVQAAELATPAAEGGTKTKRKKPTETEAEEQVEAEEQAAPRKVKKKKKSPAAGCE